MATSIRKLTSSYLVAASAMLVAFFLGGAAGAQQPSAEVINVSLAGDDNWSGRLAAPNSKRTDGPVRSLSRAQAMARTALQAMAGGSPRKALRISIAPGLYRLTEPWVFAPTDSGEPGFPVTYEAQVAGTVIISGGVELTLDQPAVDGRAMRFNSPADDQDAMAGGSQLFINGERATLARYPKRGTYWFVQQPASLPDEPASERGREAFIPSDDARQWLSGLSVADKQRAIVHVMQSWSAGRHRLSDLPAPAGAVRLKPRARWPFLEFGLNQRYFIDNVGQAFGDPGEWLWDASGVHYMLPPGQNKPGLSAVMPMIETLLVIKGDKSKSQWVHDLQFHGLSFAHTRSLTPKAGDSDTQAASAVDAAIMVDAARRISFDNCDIAHVGGYGLWFRESVRESTVINSRFTDLGGGGVKIGLPTQLPNDAAATGAIKVMANTVKDTGKVFPGAIGIWVGQSFDNEITRNLIANTSYTGISVGWRWGQGPASSGRNRIEQNLLVNIGMGQLSDLGAIYTLGESPGTTIIGNVVQEVRAYTGYGAGAWGIYNDEGSSNLRVEHNVVLGTTSGGYHLHYGRDNLVQANVFAFGDEAEVRLPIDGKGSKGLRFAENMLLPNAAQTFTAPNPETPTAVTFSGNVITAKAGRPASSAGACEGGCRSGAQGLTIASDVRNTVLVAADPDTQKWFTNTLKNAGPAGLLAASIPAVEKPLALPMAPPIAWALDLEGAPLGSPPAGLRAVNGRSNGKVSVEASTSAPKGRCLQFLDAPNPSRPWEPFVSVDLNHRTGKTRVHFTLQIDAQSDFIHEWRDASKPYRTGPSLRFTANGVQVAGKTIARMKPGEWVNVVLVVDFDAAQPRWSVDVNGPAGAGRADGLLPASLDWKRLDWLGFISNTNVVSTACIGTLDVANSASR